MMYSKYVVLEVREVRRHAYFLRERLQTPVTDDEAARDWMTTSLPEEYCARFSQRENEIETMCSIYCAHGTCRGAKECPLSPEEIREALGGEYHVLPDE